MKYILVVIPLILSNNLFAEKLNVIVIMADDLGYNDLGFQGSTNVKIPD